MSFVPQYSDYISIVRLPGSDTIYHIKDSEARDWIEQLASAGIKFTVAWKGDSTPDVTKIPLGVTVTYQGTDYTGTLVASETTAPYIQLVYKKTTAGGRKIYEEYITVTEGSGESGDSYTYFWEELGDTDISIDDLGDMAFADTASGSVTVTGNTGTISSTGTFTAHGTVSKPAVDVTPQTTSITGVATVGTLPTKEADTFSAGTLPSKSADSWNAGSLPSFTEGTFTAGTTPIIVSADSSTETLTFTLGTAPSKTADSFTAGTLPSYTEGTFSAGTLPSFTEGSFNPGSLPTTATAVNAVTSVSAELHEAPTFTGTSGETVNVSSTGVTVTSTGNVTVTPNT